MKNKYQNSQHETDLQKLIRKSESLLIDHVLEASGIIESEAKNFYYVVRSGIVKIQINKGKNTLMRNNKSILTLRKKLGITNNSDIPYLLETLKFHKDLSDRVERNEIKLGSWIPNGDF